MGVSVVFLIYIKVNYYFGGGSGIRFARKASEQNKQLVIASKVCLLLDHIRIYSTCFILQYNIMKCDNF